MQSATDPPQEETLQARIDAALDRFQREVVARGMLDEEHAAQAVEVFAEQLEEKYAGYQRPRSSR